jgi:hypothetical protein
MRYLSSISLALIVQVLLSIVVLMALACTAEPTSNIDATVEARLAEERAMEAPEEPRGTVQKTVQLTPAPATLKAPTPLATATALPEPTDTRASQTVTPIPTLKPTSEPSPITNDENQTESGQPMPIPRFLEKPYIGQDGLEVTLTSLSSSVTGNVTSITISYTLSNPTPNLIAEGSWKLYYTAGNGLPQYGGFGELIPGQRLDRSYTFNVSSPNKPWYVGYPSRFFGDWKEEDLLWEVDQC